MHFRIYQPRIDERRYHEVNDLGWEGVTWGAAYLGVTSIWPDDPASARVKAALEEGLYQHAWIVDADDVTDVFALTNMPAGPDRIIWKHPKAMSGSVGDVAIGSDGSAWVCIAIGWAELAEDVRDALLANVDTFMPAE